MGVSLVWGIGCVGFRVQGVFRVFRVSFFLGSLVCGFGYRRRRGFGYRVCGKGFRVDRVQLLEVVLLERREGRHARGVAPVQSS